MLIYHHPRLDTKARKLRVCIKYSKLAADLLMKVINYPSFTSFGLHFRCKTLLTHRPMRKPTSMFSFFSKQTTRSLKPLSC